MADEADRRLDPKRFDGFKTHAGRATNGLAMIFDLEGFSKFFNQPDVHEYVPTYLNLVIDAVERCIFGGPTVWTTEGDDVKPLGILPIHRKFLGDGMLYVWSFSGLPPEECTMAIVSLCNRLWNLKRHFSKVNAHCTERVPVADLPSRIRFGIGRGTIMELTRDSASEREYIGFCINLASRLQEYCRALGFIASARVSLPDEVLKTHGYRKVIATQLKGFPKEIVVVDSIEFQRLEQATRSLLFEPTEPEHPERKYRKS
jgi:class 3 adenylate cyclase